MTKRSVLIGLAGAVLICGLTFLNDRVLKGTYLVGSHLPVAVYGPLVVFVMLLNPLFKRLALSGREIAVALTLTLAACCVPASGLMRTFTSSLIMPHYHEKTEPAWQTYDVVDRAPQQMLVDVSEDEDGILTAFASGLGSPESHASFWDVPWSAWSGVVLLWLPPILALWGALTALAVVVHRQWSRHEQCPYPLAAVTASLLPPEGEKGSPVLRNRLFWIPMLIVFALNLNNYGFVWYPRLFVHIPTKFDFSPLAQFFPTLVEGGGGRLFSPTIYMTAVGIAYFVPTDVALALGIGPWLWALVAGAFAAFGFALDGVLEGGSWYIGVKPSTFVLFGANMGLFASMVYTGRHYYRSVLKQSFVPGAEGEATPNEVLACRLFLGLMAAFVLYAAFFAEIGIVLAALYAGILVMLFVVMSRLIAEAGLFYIQPYVFPCVVLWGLFGVNALGLTVLLAMQMLTVVLFIDPRESLMPFMTNSLKLLERRGARRGRTAWIAMGAVVLGLAVALPVTLYIQYDQGSTIWEGWAERAVTRMPFDNAVKVGQRLDAQGMLDDVTSAGGGWRPSRISPNWTCIVATLAGLAAVTVFSVVRLRFPGWPVHPILFVTWCTEPVRRLCASFLIGWALKSLVVRYGGGKMHERLKPLAIGLVAGEILGALVPVAIGVIYYLVKGVPPRAFHVLPT
ncbi:MAG: hypothetical protein GF400_07960 [Candidatus Eisenbacteria bacterium]|nr:hypothetical protein [Candidatus Eisenbacteria bacterium]